MCLGSLQTKKVISPLSLPCIPQNFGRLSITLFRLDVAHLLIVHGHGHGSPFQSSGSLTGPEHGDSGGHIARHQDIEDL